MSILFKNVNHKKTKAANIYLNRITQFTSFQLHEESLIVIYPLPRPYLSKQIQNMRVTSVIEFYHGMKNLLILKIIFIKKEKFRHGEFMYVSMFKGYSSAV